AEHVDAEAHGLVRAPDGVEDGHPARALAGRVEVRPGVAGVAHQAAVPREGDDHQVRRALLALAQGPVVGRRGHEARCLGRDGGAPGGGLRQLLRRGGARRARGEGEGEKQEDGAARRRWHRRRAYAGEGPPLVGRCRASSVSPTSSQLTPASARRTPRWKTRSAASPFSSWWRDCSAATTVSPASSTTFWAT